MAKIEDLIDEVGDPRLREDLAREVRDIKEAKRFGLVFEEHIPETVSLAHVGLGHSTSGSPTSLRASDAVATRKVRLGARAAGNSRLAESAQAARSRVGGRG